MSLMDELLSLDDICEQLGDAEAGESVTTPSRAAWGWLIPPFFWGWFRF